MGATPTGNDNQRRERPRGRRPLLLATAVVLAYFFVEVAGAIMSGSLALLADAAHTVSDVGALALALGAAWLAGWPGTPRRTFGYLRAEVLAALVNGVALLAVAAFIIIEALQRLAAPPEVAGTIVSLVAAGGIGANSLAALILLRGSHQSINVRAALFHVGGDAIGSVGVLVAGVLVTVQGWHLADPIVSVLIALMLALGAVRVLREATHVLLEGSPSHVDMKALREDIEALGHVADVHDLHTWTLTSGYHAMSAHVTMGDDCSRRAEAALLAELRRMVAEKYAVTHVTIQLERGEPECEEEAHLPEVVEKSSRIR